MRLSIILAFASCFASAGAFTSVESSTRNTYLSASAENEHDLGRRELFRKALVTSAGTAALVLSPVASNIPAANAADAAALDDLPPEAQRSYRQYRIALQIGADYYLWELRDKISRIDDWGEVNEVRLS